MEHLERRLLNKAYWWVFHAYLFVLSIIHVHMQCGEHWTLLHRVRLPHDTGVHWSFLVCLFWFYFGLCWYYWICRTCSHCSVRGLILPVISSRCLTILFRCAWILVKIFLALSLPPSFWILYSVFVPVSTSHSFIQPFAIKSPQFNKTLKHAVAKFWEFIQRAKRCIQSRTRTLP
jgi:hypothetical protein